MGQGENFENGKEFDLRKEEENLIKEAKTRKSIRVVNKNLKEIDSEIFTILRENNIKEITSICVSNSKLSKIPKFIFKEIVIKNLECLDFTSNFIQFLPKEISNLQKIETIYLSGNRLSQLPSR